MIEKTSTCQGQQNTLATWKKSPEIIAEKVVYLVPPQHHRRQNLEGRWRVIPSNR